METLRRHLGEKEHVATAEIQREGSAVGVRFKNRIPRSVVIRAAGKLGFTVQKTRSGFSLRPRTHELWRIELPKGEDINGLEVISNEPVEQTKPRTHSDVTSLIDELKEPEHRVRRANHLAELGDELRVKPCAVKVVFIPPPKVDSKPVQAAIAIHPIKEENIQRAMQIAGLKIFGRWLPLSSENGTLSIMPKERKPTWDLLIWREKGHITRVDVRSLHTTPKLRLSSSDREKIHAFFDALHEQGTEDPKAIAGEIQNQPQLEISEHTTPVALTVAPVITGNAVSAKKVIHAASYCIRPPGFTAIGKHVNAGRIANALKAAELPDAEQHGATGWIDVLPSWHGAHPHGKLKGLGITDVIAIISHDKLTTDKRDRLAAHFDEIDKQIRKHLVKAVRQLNLHGTKVRICRSTSYTR